MTKITIQALLARINRKLAPAGKIQKVTPQKAENGLAIWEVIENNSVVQTFDDMAEFHQYAVDHGVLNDIEHVTFPEGYFPKGSGFEGVTKSLYADSDGSPSLGLMWVGEDVAQTPLSETNGWIQNYQLDPGLIFDGLQSWLIVALRETMPELSKVEFDYNDKADMHCVVEGTAPKELIRYINIAFGVAQVHLSRLVDEPADDLETRFQSIVDQAANAIRSRYRVAA